MVNRTQHIGDYFCLYRRRFFRRWRYMGHHASLQGFIDLPDDRFCLLLALLNGITINNNPFSNLSLVAYTPHVINDYPGLRQIVASIAQSG